LVIHNVISVAIKYVAPGDTRRWYVFLPI